jgi:hypothetical protein
MKTDRRMAFSLIEKAFYTIAITMLGGLLYKCYTDAILFSSIIGILLVLTFVIITSSVMLKIWGIIQKVKLLNV